jgi:hypothetical protein
LIANKKELKNSSFPEGSEGVLKHQISKELSLAEAQVTLGPNRFPDIAGSGGATHITGYHFAGRCWKNRSLIVYNFLLAYLMCDLKLNRNMICFRLIALASLNICKIQVIKLDHITCLIAFNFHCCAFQFMRNVAGRGY